MPDPGLGILVTPQTTLAVGLRRLNGCTRTSDQRWCCLRRPTMMGVRGPGGGRDIPSMEGGRGSWVLQLGSSQQEPLGVSGGQAIRSSRHPMDGPHRTVWYELQARDWPLKNQAAEALIWQIGSGEGMKRVLASVSLGKEVTVSSHLL